MYELRRLRTYQIQSLSLPSQLLRVRLSNTIVSNRAVLRFRVDEKRVGLTGL